MVTDSELEKILENLPKVIKEKPELAYKFYKVLKEEFATVESLREYMEQSDRRFRELMKSVKDGFTRMDKRFEAVDKRFDAADKRFDASDKRFEALITEMNKRFDAVDERFEVLTTELLKVKVGIGTLGRKVGEDFEGVILNIYKKALEARGIDISKVEKKGVYDELGELYHQGAKVQVDMYAHNGEHILFEVKYTANEEDVDVFFRKAKFIEKKLGIVAQKTIIAIDIDEQAINLCKKLGIDVITG